MNHCLTAALLESTASRPTGLQDDDSSFGTSSAVSVPVELGEAIDFRRHDVKVRLHRPGSCEPRYLRAVDVVAVGGVSSLDSGIGDKHWVGGARCGIDGEVLVTVGRGAVVEMLVD